MVKERDFGKVIKPAWILCETGFLEGKCDFRKRKVIPTIGYTFDGRGGKVGPVCRLCMIVWRMRD